MILFALNLIGLVEDGTAPVRAYAFNCLTKSVQELSQTIDEAQAIDVAKRFVAQRYGEADERDAEPFSGKLKSGVWTVSGYIPPDNIGGTYVVLVDARTGCVLAHDVNL